MLQTRSLINIVDNTDVLTVRVFKPRAIRKLGDLISGSVVKVRTARSTHTGGNKGQSNSATSNTTLNKGFKRGDVVHVLLINTKFNTKDKLGNIKFGENRGVLMNDSGKEGWLPLGTRINGVVPRILRSKGWGNVVAISEHSI